jgi:CBS domain-containing protein
MPKYVYDDCTVRQAADHMVNHDIGRLPVVRRAQPHAVVGMITRSDILSVYRRHLRDAEPQQPTLTKSLLGFGRNTPSSG